MSSIMVFSKCKLFGITVLLCLVLISTTNASVHTDISMDFKQDGSCLVKCGTTEKLFNNINELSSGLNSITGEYLNISHINTNNNIYNEFKSINKNHGRSIVNPSTIKSIQTGIVFNGVHNEIGCNLLLNSSYIENGYGPGIVFKCDNKGARFLNMTVEPNILFFGIRCDFPDKVHIDELYVVDSNSKVKISFIADENIVIKKSAARWCNVNSDIKK